MFSQSTFDKIHERSILEIADKLLIRYHGKTGKFRMCKCFMHDDRNPSMWFKLSNNTWYCAVCGKGGDVIKLVMEHEKLTFNDAVRWIVRECNIFCLDDDQRPRQKRITKHHTARQTITTKFSDIMPQNIQTLSADLVDKSQSTVSPFCQALLSNGILSEAQMHNVARRYRLGATHNGGVIFWTIDSDDRVREGKVMYYKSDCHRDHDRSPTTISSLMKKQGKLPKDFSATTCLFGLHLLRETSANDDTIVAVVESEKTAVICSELIPAIPSDGHPDRHSPVIWLATGGLPFLSIERLAPLVGHRVIIFPDTDTDRQAFKQWKAKAEEASRTLGQPFPVSDILERQASNEQKQRKIDIADLLLEEQKKQAIIHLRN